MWKKRSQKENVVFSMWYTVSVKSPPQLKTPARLKRGSSEELFEHEIDLPIQPGLNHVKKHQLY